MQSKYIFFILVLATLFSSQSDPSNTGLIGILDGIRRGNYSGNNPFTTQERPKRTVEFETSRFFSGMPV